MSENISTGALNRTSFSDGATPSQPLGVSWQPLYDRANRLFSQLQHCKDANRNQEADCYMNLIVSIFELHEYFDNNPHEYDGLLRMRHVTLGRSENPYFSTVESVMLNNSSTKGKTTRTYYAQVCYAMKWQGVTADKALAWLKEPTPSQATGRNLTGIKKALHVWSQTDLGQKQLRLKAESKNKRDRRTLERAFEELSENNFHPDDVANGSRANDGSPVLLLGRIVSGSLELKGIITTNSSDVSAALKKIGFDKNKSARS